MSDLPASYDSWKAPDPPDDPPRKHTEDDYEPSMCWFCFELDDELKPLQAIHTRTEVYGPDDEGEEDYDWQLSCVTYGVLHNPGEPGDPYTFAEHVLAILENVRELWTVKETPSWAAKVSKLIREWEGKVRDEQA